jgi:hypothetical protein
MVKMDKKDILKKFPKIRPELPQEYRDIYETHYKKNRAGNTRATSLSMRMEKWLHKKVAADVKNNDKDIKTLEIGAGTLNQLEYEPNIKSYNIVEPFKALYENSPYLHRVSNVFDSIHDIEDTEKYSRIISIATFEHIMELPQVVAKAALLLKEDGNLRLSIPNEGTLLWKLGTMVTGAEFKKHYGLDYDVLMRYEHVNTADDIEQVLKYFFRKTKTKVLGINRRFAFYRFISCEQPEVEKARLFLER